MVDNVRRDGQMGRVSGKWDVKAFTDGTTTQQSVTANPAILAGLISMTGADNAGIVTINDGTNSYAFAAAAIPIGGLFFAGGIGLDLINITIASSLDDIMVLYKDV